MPFTPKLTYKGKPLVRKDNELYYGRMTDPYVLRMQILSTKPVGGLKSKLGKPDLLIFFTNTMSHKMVQIALSEIKGQDTVIERCHTSSLSALRGILEKRVC